MSSSLNWIEVLPLTADVNSEVADPIAPSNVGIMSETFDGS